MHHFASLALVLWVLSLSLLGGCSPTLITPNSKLAYDVLTTEDYSEALLKDGLYEQAFVATLQSSPEFLEKTSTQERIFQINERLLTVHNLLQKSIVAMRAGELNVAEQFVDEALEIYPQYDASLLLRQTLGFLTPVAQDTASPPVTVKQTGKKIKFAPPIIEIPGANSGLAYILFVKGQEFFDKGNPDKAKEIWYKGLKFAPNHTRIKNGLVSLLTNQGLLSFGDGQFRDAINSWEEVLQLQPENQKVANYIARANQAIERIDSVERELAKKNNSPKKKY